MKRHSRIPKKTRSVFIAEKYLKALCCERGLVVLRSHTSNACWSIFFPMSLP
jgi:hypothetical protein